MVSLNKVKDRVRGKTPIRQLIFKIVNEIRCGYQPEKIILFGSYACGRPTKDSDIDLFIIKETDRPRRERFVEVSKLLFKISSDVSVEPLVFTPEELRERITIGDPFILEILQKGEVLYDRAAEIDARVVSARRK